ncbi:hypothetical protein OBBRIDRAFT_357985 [Obba rivulosa]|uniref:Uncharacterized protein n=1 Tax=Obba rivulosa TaxID=1052685 RepID=A0A8E2DFJ5_9APHY|nr:hypothetical protein OBBRIDRAFT_357985 [Obba rivulosa]
MPSRTCHDSPPHWKRSWFLATMAPSHLRPYHALKCRRSSSGIRTVRLLRRSCHRSLTFAHSTLLPSRHQLCRHLLRGQKLHARTRHFKSHTWRLLDTVNAEFWSLYVMNLGCRICRLSLEHRDEDIWAADYGWLVKHLTVTRPSTLSIKFNRRRHFWLGHISSVTERYTGLSDLVLDMNIEKYNREGDTDFTLLRAISRLFPSTTHLVVSAES